MAENFTTDDPREVLADADRWLAQKGVPSVSGSIRMVRRLRDALRVRLTTDA